MDRHVASARQRIQNLLVRATSESVDIDDELKADLARYMCILCSGLIEEALKLSLTNYAKSRSNPQVASFVTARLGEFQNPKFEKVLTLLAAFDPKWREHFEIPELYEMKDAIDSVVNNRNQIAHGKPVGVSIITFANYFALVERFIDNLDDLILK